MNSLRQFHASLFLARQSWNNCQAKKSKSGLVSNKKWTPSHPSSWTLNFSGLTSNTFSCNSLTTVTKESNSEQRFKNWTSTMRREILSNNTITKNILKSLMKFWKKCKSNTKILPWDSFLQDWKPGQMRKIKKCSMRFVSWSGNTLWDLILFKRKPFTVLSPNTIQSLIGSSKSIPIWTTKRCITQVNRKTRPTKTCKSPFRRAVWELVTVSTLCKELNSWPTKSTCVSSKTQRPISCSATLETPETHRLQFCWDLDSQWPSIQTILESSDLKMQLRITSWLLFPTSGDWDIWNLWLCMRLIMRFVQRVKNCYCKRFSRKNGWTGSRISSRLKFNDFGMIRIHLTLWINLNT